MVGTVVVASVGIRSPTPPPPRAIESRSSPVHTVSRPASTDAACSYKTLARPGSACVRPRPLGKVCRKRRPASAKPDFGRRTSFDADDKSGVSQLQQAIDGVVGQSTTDYTVEAQQDQVIAKYDESMVGSADVATSSYTQLQRQVRPTTAPSATSGTVPSCRTIGGRGLHVLGTIASDDDRGLTWSYSDYATASTYATGPPGSLDKTSLVPSIESTSTNAEQRPWDLVQKQKQREQQWQTTSSALQQHGNALRYAAATGAFRRERSTDASSRDAQRHSEVFKWQAPTDCGGRRGSDSGAIVAWSN